MSDRGFLFLFSAAMILGALASVAWLVSTGQALTLDGLFLICTALVLAAGFAVYLIYLLRRAAEAPKPVPAAAKAAASAPGKQTPAQAEG